MSRSVIPTQGAAGAVEGAKVLERLHAEGRISQEILERIVAESGRTQEHPIDLLVDFGIVSEADLLRFLAKVYQTQFVTSEKLAKANVERAVLELVPVRVAEKVACFPVLFDRRTAILSVVAADLESEDVQKNLMLATQVRGVKVYVARPKAVKAAIRRSYYGDARAFQALLSAPKRDNDSSAYDMGFGYQADAGFGGNFGSEARTSTPGGSDYGFGGGGLDDFDELAASAKGKAAAAPTAAAARPAAPAPPPPPTFQISAPEIAQSLSAVSGFTPLDTPTQNAPSSAPPPPAPQQGGEAYLETLNVLVALLEQGRDELRGHSSQVASLCRKVAERMGLTAASTHELVVAAYLHDVGKASTYHLTALNVAQYEGHRSQAQKAHLAPVRLFEAAQLAKTTIDALTHLYERFDGQGFPDRQSGKEIPLAARILAAVETYVDVTTTTRNPYRRKLGAAEACEALARFRGNVFDPTVLDLLKALVLGDDLRHKLLADRRRVLLVDPDPEETTVLEMRLVEHGYDVTIARDADAALKKLADGEVDILVTEVELGGTDGFKLMQRVKQSSQPDVPILLLTRRGDRDSVNRGFELGAADYVVKPASADVVVAKVRQTLGAEARNAAKAGRGVSGSLREMALPDVVQILANGRKSGRLQIRGEGKAGDMAFRDGMVCEAQFGGRTGAEAFYAMLLLTDGDFALDTSYVPAANTINLATESLLLEGMRRLDEGRR
ncbi:MAG: DUF4388 domain-containing protein [Polyangiales bacterium]